MSQRPLVAIVGAPNVGKSTLFNRLVRERKSIVTDEPGVTRDRIYGRVDDARVPFRLVDTGGLTPSTAAPFAREIERQAASAMDEAALILFVVDVRALTSLDLDVAALLRRARVPVLLVANKADTEAQEIEAQGLHRLGLDGPLCVASEHGRGIGELLDAICDRLEAAGIEPAGEESPEDEPIKIAIVGRPNVGKSSLVNRLLGEERVLVSEVPGTTRDAVDSLLVREGRRYLLVDTAGIRRKGRVRLTAETLSVVRARHAIARADVVVLVLDATDEVGAQDLHIAGYANDAARPVIAAVNKWDAVEGREEAAKEWERRVRTRLKFIKETPVAFISARTGQRASRILDLAEEVHRAGGVKVPTPELNRWLQSVADAERSAPARGRSIRMFYAAQTGVHPPRFLIFCNEAAHVHFSLRRHLENSLRERFGFGPAPIRLAFRSRRRKETA